MWKMDSGLYLDSKTVPGSEKLVGLQTQKSYEKHIDTFLNGSI